MKIEILFKKKIQAHVHALRLPTNTSYYMYPPAACFFVLPEQLSQRCII